MRELFRFLHHLSVLGSASGGKRAAYAVWHIVAMILAALCAFGAYWLATNYGTVFEINIIVGILGLVAIPVCAVLGFIFFMQGVVAQIATIIISAVALKNKEDVAANIFAILIAVASLIALTVIIIMVVSMLQQE